MDASNGSLGGPKTKGAKGYSNGKANGIKGALKVPKPSLNGNAAVPRQTTTRQRTTRRQRGFVARIFNIVARLLTWYSILTLLFRCPANLEACDETSPRICKPYFQVKHAVIPHLEPYYNIYAAPYVELARPYYDTLDQRVITPGRGFATKYAAPQVQKAQAYGKVQWDKSIQPQVHKYQSLAKAQYDQNLAPHVNTVASVAVPYYDIARTNALQTYHDLLVPSYDFLQPYAYKGFNAASSFTTSTAIPSTVFVWNKTYHVLEGMVWPHIRALYVENVEPQLVKIGRRLGRYHGQQTTAKPVAKALTTASKAASSFTRPTPSVSSSVSSAVPSASVSTTSTITTETTETATAAHTQGTPEATPSKNNHVQAPEWEQGEQEDAVRRSARETVAADLKDWQERYAKAADEGAVEIENRVDEIAHSMIDRNAHKSGRALLEQLQATVVSELVTLRRDILNIVGAVSKGNAKEADGKEQLVSAVRRAGMAIKEKAQEVRTWRESYEAELHGAVTTAAEEHFKTLDTIRDLAVQKIGMKWAWTDGITYRDWQKYHLLKDRFDEWHGDLEKLIVSHPGLEAAQREGATIEDEAMNTAQSAAKELARLKQVGNWKLTAADTTDEFDSGLTKQAAALAERARSAAQSAAEQVKDGAGSFADSVVDAVSEAVPVSEASEAVKSATLAASGVAESARSSGASIASSVSDKASSFMGDTAVPRVESLASEGSQSVSSATNAVKSVASEGTDSVYRATKSASSLAQKGTEAAKSVASEGTNTVNSAADAATKSAASLAGKASESVSSATESASSIAGNAALAAESVASQGTNSVSSAAKSASSIAVEASASVLDAPSSVESAASEATVKSSSASRPDLASTATEEVLTETPVIAGDTSELTEEDGPAPVELPLEGEDMEEPEVVDEEAEEAFYYHATTTSVKSAMFGAAAQDVPTRTPIMDDDSFDAAASVMSSIRNEMPSQFSSLAQSAYSAASARANVQYSQALSAVSVQIHGTPKPAHEEILSSITSVYGNAMASASSRLDQALQAASKQFAADPTPSTVNILPTAIPRPTVPSVDWERIESIASERLANGKAWAEEQYESAKVRVGLATPTPSTPSEHVDKLLQNARHNYYAGVGVAYARYSEFLSAASSAVSSMTATPTPTDFAGTVSSLASVASESAASVAAAAGENASAAGFAASASAVSAASAASASAASVASVASASAASAASVASASAASAASVVGENVSSVAAAGYEGASVGYDKAASAASVVGDNVASVAASGYDNAASAASIVSENASSVAAAGYDAASSGYENVASVAGAAADAVGDNWDNLVSQLSVRVYGAPTPTPWYESMYSVLGDYASSATGGASTTISGAGAYVTAASEQATQQYHVVSSIISELVIGKEPSFTDSVYSRLNDAYKTGAASASSLASVAQESAASGLSGASEAVQSASEKVASAASKATGAVKDEL